MTSIVGVVFSYFQRHRSCDVIGCCAYGSSGVEIYRYLFTGTHHVNGLLISRNLRDNLIEVLQYIVNNKDRLTLFKYRCDRTVESVRLMKCRCGIYVDSHFVPYRPKVATIVSYQVDGGRPGFDTVDSYVRATITVPCDFIVIDIRVHHKAVIIRENVRTLNHLLVVIFLGNGPVSFGPHDNSRRRRSRNNSRGKILIIGNCCYN